MNIKWLGTATILIEDNGSKILIDPYLAKYDNEAFNFYTLNYSDIDAIFITHPHLDHFADISYFMRRTSCKIYVNHRGIRIAQKLKLNMNRFVELSHSDVIQIDTLKIKAYSGRHIKFDHKQKIETVTRIFKNKMVPQAVSIAKEHLKFHINRNDVLDFYISTGVENVFVLGSAETHPSVHYPKNIETLILPYQGRSDMCKQAEMVVNKLKPQKIFLDHFDDAFPPISQNVRLTEFSRLMRKHKIPVIIPVKEA